MALAGKYSSCWELAQSCSLQQETLHVVATVTRDCWLVQKASTQRSATASGRVLLGPQAFGLVAVNAIKKGDVLTVAQIAGIMGAKHTSLLVRPPLLGRTKQLALHSGRTH